LRKNGLLTVHFPKKEEFKDAFLMFYQPKKMFAGHINVLGGPHVARGPDVAQACSIPCTPKRKSTCAKAAHKMFVKLTSYQPRILRDLSQYVPCKKRCSSILI